MLQGASGEPICASRPPAAGSLMATGAPSAHLELMLSPRSKTKCPSLSGPRSGGDGRLGTTKEDRRVGSGTPGLATARLCRLSGGSCCCCTTSRDAQVRACGMYADAGARHQGCPPVAHCGHAACSIKQRPDARGTALLSPSSIRFTIRSGDWGLGAATGQQFSACEACPLLRSARIWRSMDLSGRDGLDPGAPSCKVGSVAKPHLHRLLQDITCAC